MTEAGMAVVTFDVKSVKLDAPIPKREPVEMSDAIKRVLQSRPASWRGFQKLSPSHQRQYILWLADAKKPETFERRLNKMGDELSAGKPTSMH